MRARRYQTALIVGFILLVLLVFWMAFRSGSSIRVAFSTAHGHFPETALVVGHQLSILWVTNTGPSAITLESPYVQFENAAGRLVRDQGSS
jgi:hypothetical protein